MVKSNFKSDQKETHDNEVSYSKADCDITKHQASKARPTSIADSRAKITNSCQEFGKPGNSPTRSQARGIRIQTAKESKSSCSKSAARMHRDLELAKRRFSPSMRIHIDVTNSMEKQKRRTTMGNLKSAAAQLNRSMVGPK